jgi:hypothetical protein
MMVMSVIVIMIMLVMMFMTVVMFLMMVIMGMSEIVFEFFARRLVVMVFMRVDMTLVGMLMVMVFVVFMKMLILLNAQRNDTRMGACYAALYALLKTVCNIRNTQRIELVFARFDIACELCERCQEHVTCSTHIAFNI